MFSSFRHYMDILGVLTNKELKVRYSSSFLGYLWSLANPLAFAGVFYLAFKIVMKVEIPNFILFLIAGLFPWQWLSNSVGASPGVFLGNASLIKKLNFPRNLFVFTQVTQDMIHFLLAIPVILVVLISYSKYPTAAWIYGVPILIVLHFSLAYGISMALASINLFFRDLERLTGILLMLLFYCSPVCYSETMIPEKFKFLITLNPVSPLIICWRTLFMEGRFDTHYASISALFSVGAVVLGHLVFSKLRWRFAEVL